MSTSRPGWMEGGTRRPKAPRPPQQRPPQQAPASAPASEPRIVVNVPDGPTTHRNVVVGVTLLTILALFSTFFWVGIGIAAALSPPEAEVTFSGGIELVTLGDYLTFPRLTLGVVSGVIGTAGAWIIVDNMLE